MKSEKPYRNRRIRNLIQRPDGSFGIDIIFEGKRIREWFRTKTDAVARLDLIRGQKARRKIGLDEPKKRNGDVTFDAFGERFIATYSTQKRPKTKTSHQTSFNALKDAPEFRGKMLSEITGGMIAAYMARRAAVHRVSANRELSFLKLLFRKAIEWEQADRNPAAGEQKFEEIARAFRILTPNEAGRLIAAAAKHLRPIIRVLLGTGMRKKEALSLEWATGEIYGPDTPHSVIDLDERMIFIPAAIAKTHKSRFVPLSADLVDLFKSLRADAKKKEPRVFPFDEIRKAFQTAARRAKIRNLVIHDLRHTAITWMIDAGCDIVTVAEIVGHSDIRITARYCRQDDAKKRAAVAKLAAMMTGDARTRQKMTDAEKSVPAIAEESIASVN